MENTDWRLVMQQYHAAKYSVIPINKERKPYHKEWSKWNDELPDAPLYSYGQRGLAILPGKESGVMIVDIDTENEHLLNELKKIIPTSPVQRFGSKGIGLIFAYNENVVSRKFRNIQVEIFANSGYVVIPPSYHNKTNSYYKWIGPSLLEFDRENLPTFNTDVIKALSELDSEVDGLSPDKIGRHVSLYKQASAALHKNKDPDEIAKEIADYDLTKHEISYFKDEHRAKNDADVLVKARKFVDRCIKTYEKHNGRYEVIGQINEEIKISDKFEIKNYPKDNAIIGSIAELISESAYTGVPNMSFGSALTIFSSMVGNHHYFDDISGNIFSLLLAESGTGKKFGLDIAKRIFEHDNLIESANYLSSSAISSRLFDYKVRLDLSDEFSKTLRVIKDGGVWQQIIVQELCDLWSASNGSMLVSSVKKKDDDKSSSVKMPYVSILGATTLSEFKLSVDKSTFNSGLISRFLFFVDKPSADFKYTLNFSRIDSMLEKIIDLKNEIKKENKVEDYNGCPKNRFRLGVASKDLSLFKDIIKRCHLEALDKKEGTAERYLLSRNKEHIKKLSLLHALSRFQKQEIEAEDLLWAEEVFKVSYYNQSLFMAEAGAENQQQSEKERLFGIVKSDPGITKRNLTRLTQFLNGKQRQLYIQDLIDAGRMGYREIEAGKGKKTHSYFPIES